MQSIDVSSSMQSLGRRLASVAPSVARLTFALPRLFVQGANIFFGRLFQAETIVIIVAVIALSIPIILALLFFDQQTILTSLPNDRSIIDFIRLIGGELVQTLNAIPSKEGLDTYFLFAALIVVLIVAPFVLSFLVVVTWNIGKFFIYTLPALIISWMIYLVSGKLIGKYKALNEWGENLGDAPTPAEGNQSEKETITSPDVTTAPVQDAPAANEPTTPTGGSDAKVASMPADGGFETKSQAGADTNASSPPQTERPEQVQNAIKTRLNDLLRDFRRREETNLGIGMIFSILGVLLLLTLIFFGSSRSDFVAWFVPRFSVALFIQIFAYFFLRLYRENLSDIKYFNNELTNVEFKEMATELALKLNSKSEKAIPKQQYELLSQLCLELLRTERNFILKKGETAVTDKEEESHSKADLTKQLAKVLKEVQDLVKLKS